ncbi:MAG: hypothetical protein LBQ57_04460 [Spirochaetales bacterium]|nr:hypothetical protein [Spirochaetales bacterium]
MKKLAKFSVFLLVLLGVLFTSGCSLGDDDDNKPGYTDDPLAGKMTAATAAKIFEYEENADGGVTITRFINSDGSLQAYLKNAGQFIIGEIEGKPVTAIGAGAFDETENGAAALPEGLEAIKLPDTIKEVGQGAFNVTGTINLLIPAAVLTVLETNDPYILYEISQSVTITIKKVTAGSENGEELETPPPQAYKIELAASVTHGTMNPKSGKQGDTITLTPVPNTGYIWKTDAALSVTKKGDSAIVVPLSGFTFTMPAYDVTVSGVEFEEGYLITSAADLAKIGNGNPLNGKYLLTDDITVSNWTPTGTGAAPFSGVFDGAGYTITMTGTLASVAKAIPSDWIEDSQGIATTMQVAGLFGSTGGAEIKNLNVVWNGNALSFSGGSALLFAGIVAGWAENTDFTNIMISGAEFSVTAPKIFGVGALAGYAAYGGEVSQCGSSVNVKVTATAMGFYVGGLLGAIDGEDVSLSESFASGNVTTTGCEKIGGLAGANLKGEISDSYATGNVNISYSGSAYEVGVGGLIGQSDAGIITKSYSRGTVSGTNTGGKGAFIGGISGENWMQSGVRVAISNCAALNGSLTHTGGGSVTINRIAPNTNADGYSNAVTFSSNIANSAMTVTGGTFTEKTASGRDGADADAKPAQSVFEGLGWDFTNTWEIGGDGYPVLQWQE